MTSFRVRRATPTRSRGAARSAGAAQAQAEQQLVLGCVAGVVKSMSFPPADGITSCNYPFVFQMVGE